MGFGVVLYKVGATRYSRVMGMLTLRDTKVMKFAFTAIGVSSLAYGLAAALGVSGVCPGTCVAKSGGRGGRHKYAAPAAVLGLFAGVALYAALKDPLLS